MDRMECWLARSSRRPTRPGRFVHHLVVFGCLQSTNPWYELVIQSTYLTTKSPEINVFATENATTTQPGTYPWTINVPRDTVAADCQFVFRFRPHRDPKDFSFDGPMSPSRGFNLRLSSISLSMSSVALVSTLKSTLTPTPTSKFASRSSSPVSRPSPKSKFSSNAVSNTTTLFSVTSASGSMSATTTILSSDEATPVASTSATPKTSQIPNSSNRNPKIGPIIGGVLGGVILVALCMVGLYFRHYMKRREISEIVVYKPKPRTPLVEAVAPPAPPRRRAEIDGRQIPVGASHGH